MAQKQVLLTQEGWKKLQEEYEYLTTVRRKEVAERIQRAKELTDTVNNAEYDDAKNEQAFVEGRVLTLEKILKNAVVIPAGAAKEAVALGSQVTVLNPEHREEEYTVVSSAEANPSQGKISNESPVGKALVGKRVGDEVTVRVPGGTIRLTIAAIK